MKSNMESGCRQKPCGELRIAVGIMAKIAIVIAVISFYLFLDKRFKPSLEFLAVAGIISAIIGIADEVAKISHIRRRHARIHNWDSCE